MTDQRIDPDPWLVISVAINAVAMLGTLAQVAKAYGGRPKLIKEPDPTSSSESLQDLLRDTIRSVERIVKFLATRDVGVNDVLQREFAFGETSLLMDPQTFASFEKRLQAVTHNLNMLQKLTCLMLRHHPDYCAKIGIEMTRRFETLPNQINSMYRDGKTNEAVLDQVLLMLRMFERILERIERSN